MTTQEFGHFSLCITDLATETGTPRIYGDRFDLALIVSTYLHNERIAHERNLVDE
jgi:hypothetical protein